MNPLDEVARLKAQRREEIAAAEEERERTAVQSHRDSLARLDAAVRDALTGQCAPWLAEFAVPRVLPPERMPGDRRTIDVWFEPPGHRRIGLSFERRTDTAGEWVCARDDDGEWVGWYAFAGESYGTWHRSLADALIAAEIDDWTPPAPAPVVVTPEALSKAAECWPLMLAHGMPAKVALGFVEEATDGDVRVASAAIITEAVVALGNSRPSDGVERFPDVIAGLICGSISLNQFDDATRERERLAERLLLWGLGGPPDTLRAVWIEWAEDAKRVIELCVEIQGAV